MTVNKRSQLQNFEINDSVIVKFGDYQVIHYSTTTGIATHANTVATVVDERKGKIVEIIPALDLLNVELDDGVIIEVTEEDMVKTDSKMESPRIKIRPLEKFGQQKRCGGILDYPQKTLDPKLWNLDGENPYLKKEAKEEISDILYSGLEDAKFLYSKDWIVGLYFIGSSAAYQWEEDSDIDITCIVDLERLLQTETHLNLGDAERAVDLIKDIANEKLTGKLLSDTKHPINYFFRDDELVLENTDAVYDLTADTWIKPATVPKDIEQEGLFEQFQSWARKIDLDKGELWRDMVDYEKFITVLNRLEGKEEEEIKKKLQGKVREITSDLRTLSGTYDIIHSERTKAFEEQLELGKAPSRNWLPENVLYKFLERYNYIDLLKQLRKIESVPEEIPKVKEILSQYLPSSIPDVRIYTIQNRFRDDPKLGTYVSSHKSVVPGVYKVYDIYRKDGYTVYTVDPMNKMADMVLAVSFDSYAEAKRYVEESMVRRAQKEKLKPLSEFDSVTLDDGTQVLYVMDWKDIAQGLMGVKPDEFPDNMVMLFFVNGGTFHMNGVLFPIDIAFLDKEGKILKLERMIPNESYVSAPEGTAYVLEANVNWYQNKEMDVGDKVSIFDFPELKKREEEEYEAYTAMAIEREGLKKAQTELKFEDHTYDEVMSRKVRNEYYVMITNEYVVQKGNTLYPASDFSEHMRSEDVWGKIIAKYYDYPSAIVHAGIIYDEIKDIERPRKEAINSVQIEDYLSGEIFRGEVEAYLSGEETVDEEWEYTKFAHESTEFTDKALKELGYPNGINTTKSEIDAMAPKIKTLEQFGQRKFQVGDIVELRATDWLGISEDEIRGMFSNISGFKWDSTYIFDKGEQGRVLGQVGYFVAVQIDDPNEFGKTHDVVLYYYDLRLIKEADIPIKITPLDKFGQVTPKFQIEDRVKILNADNCQWGEYVCRKLVGKVGEIVDVLVEGNRYKVAIDEHWVIRGYWLAADQLALENPLPEPIPLDKFG